MNNVKIEQVEVTKLLGKKSVHNKELLCFFNNTVNKAGPTGSSLVAPGLLFSRVVRCHKDGLRKIAVGSKQGSTAGP